MRLLVPMLLLLALTGCDAGAGAGNAAGSGTTTGTTGGTTSTGTTGGTSGGTTGTTGGTGTTSTVVTTCIVDFTQDGQPDVFVMWGPAQIPDSFIATLPAALQDEYRQLASQPGDANPHLWVANPPAVGGFQDLAYNWWGLNSPLPTDSTLSCADVNKDTNPDVTIQPPTSPAMVYLNPMQPPFLDPATDMATRIRLATSWFDRTTYVDVVHASLVVNLRNRFGLVMTNDLVATIDYELGLELAAGATGQWNLDQEWRRLYDGTLAATAFLDTLTDPLANPDAITMPAAYCATYPLPSDFRNRMLTAIAAGGYYTTHALLAELFLESNGCPPPLTSSERDSLVTSVQGIISLADGSLDDLDIEAMAFLVAAGRADLLPSDAYAAFLDYQRINGGWPPKVWLATRSGPANNDHTSGLGLWLLLGLQYPVINAGPLLPPAH